MRVLDLEALWKGKRQYESDKGSCEERGYTHTVSSLRSVVGQTKLCFTCLNLSGGQRRILME